MVSDALTLCVSLGGSHAEVGMLDSRGSFFGSGAISWRARLPGGHSTAADLANLVSAEARALLARERRSQSVNLGIAFPGPRHRNGWASNNLTPDFRDGLPVETVFGCSLQAATGRQLTSTSVVLDAQADAGGELYHPDGRLYDIPLARGATVINIASGIAAGYVFVGSDDLKNHVATTAPDFRYLTGGRYDEGAGQLGRHLVTADLGETWQYEYRPSGEIACEAQYVRMTDVLSGPALAARLALRLAAEGFRANPGLPSPIGILVEHAANLLSELESQRALVRLGQDLRGSNEDPSGRLLRWADSAPEEGVSSEICSLLRDEFGNWKRFFAKSLSAWQDAPGWDGVSRALVVTGGVGQRLCRRTMPNFWDECASTLAPGTRISRSILEGGCERAAWYFRARASD